MSAATLRCLGDVRLSSLMEIFINYLAYSHVRSESEKQFSRTHTSESVVTELCQPLFCTLHHLKRIGAPVNAGVRYPAQCWFRAVAEALASQLRLC